MQFPITNIYDLKNTSQQFLEPLQQNFVYHQNALSFCNKQPEKINFIITSYRISINIMVVICKYNLFSIFFFFKEIFLIFV